ncbi:pantothenate kinase [candidate division LCP-89 bacterium B3_LCP]|uniref:Type III pantothenate kinase n=1 Tax=candidate division LCP-89 bacterium B3_LCP TaxID=2012998 RepID=A0A532UWB2_UNCL8|nr:MAG: pantothenate kinase [candidate division LCP-89 bacterium B3_LCP]
MKEDRIATHGLLLTIDVGNTNVVLGLFQGDRLAHYWRLATSVSRTSDEAWIMLKSLCDSEEIDTGQIDGMAISSVVPDLTSIFADMARDRLNIKPYEVKAETAPSLKISYKDPTAVGADRICNAVAGYDRCGGPLIVADYGTATTFDVINRQGDYLGGIITPGIELAQKILRQSAARLPKVSLQFPPKVIADTTETSIQAGILYGAVDKLEGLCRRIWDELGESGHVMATGGLSPLIAQHTEVIDTVEPNLVLEGLRILFSRHG